MMTLEIIKGQERITMAFLKNKNKSNDNDSFLNITVTNEGAEYTFLLEGRLDTLTSPDLNAKVNEVIGDAKKLIFDFKNLDYISSAGLRVLLAATQNMEGKGETVVRNVSNDVMDIFEITGFSMMFNIE